MEKITPKSLHNLFKQKKINQKKLIDELLSIYEYSDSKETRLECLEIINLESGKTESNFKILETFAISDTEIEVRLKAIKLIIVNYPESGVNLIKYLIENSTSLEFVIKLCKILGESIFSLRSNETEKYSDYLKHVMLQIFEFEDVGSFESIRGDWFYKTPKEFWNFFSNLKNSMGFLEIFGAYISDIQTFEWFFSHIFPQFTIEQWIFFLTNSKFSGQFYHTLKYLVVEKPPLRFNKIIKFFRNIYKDLTDDQKVRIIEILKKGNLFDLILIILFGWYENISNERLIHLIKDKNFNLKLKLVEILTNSRYDLLTNDYFFYSLVLFVYKIFKDIDNSFLIQVFEDLEFKVKKKFLSKLISQGSYVKINNFSNFSNEIIDYKNFKIFLFEILRDLSNHYDLKQFDLNSIDKIS